MGGTTPKASLWLCLVVVAGTLTLSHSTTMSSGVLAPEVSARVKDVLSEINQLLTDMQAHPNMCTSPTTKQLGIPSFCDNSYLNINEQAKSDGSAPISLCQENGTCLDHKQAVERLERQSLKDLHETLQSIARPSEELVASKSFIQAEARVEGTFEKGHGTAYDYATRTASTDCLEAYIYSENVSVVLTCDTQRKFVINCQDKKGMCLLRHPNQREDCCKCGKPEILEDVAWDPEFQAPA